MPRKEDIVKKEIAREKRDREIEQLYNEEEQKKVAVLAASFKKFSPAVEEEEYHFNIKPSGSNNGDWQKIIADYKKQYPDKPIQNNVLTFTTLEDAINFFTAQAAHEPPRKFLAPEVDHQGNLTGFNLYSCGNKKLYQGTLKDIQNQLKADLKQNPEDLNVKQGLDEITSLLNPTSGYRAALQEVKSPAEDEEQDKSNLPNPFNIRPKSPIEN